MPRTDEEEDDRFIEKDEAKPKYHSGGSSLTSGHTQSFRCPHCGSYNTAQGVYFDECRSCNYSQGY